MIKILQ